MGMHYESVNAGGEALDLPFALWWRLAWLCLLLVSAMELFACYTIEQLMRGQFLMRFVISCLIIRTVG